MGNNVVSLKTAQQLKAAGFPQEAYFCWDTQIDINEEMHVELTEVWTSDSGDYIAAPMGQEIADELPHSSDEDNIEDNSLEMWSWQSPTGRKWNVAYIDIQRIPHHLTTGNTIAEALALLWLKLQEGESNVTT